MFFRTVNPIKRSNVIRERPVIIIKKGVTPEGNPFKQRIYETGEKYITNGNPSGFSISKNISYMSSPNMKMKAIPKKTHMKLKNLVEDMMRKQKLYKRIAEDLNKELDIRKEDVFINLVEVAKENWSFGNGEAQYAPK